MDSDPAPFKLGQHGGKRLKGQRGPNSTLKRGSSSGPYVLARLQRDAEEGCREAAVLLQGIHDQKISAYAAGCEMNYCRRPEPSGRGSENATKRRDWAMHKLMRQLYSKTPAG
jgi:hypothetical protein